jgi:hypothetical protein
MIEMVRAEAEEALAQAEIDSMDKDEIIESLKRFFIFGNEDDVPFSEMTDDELADEYEDAFGEVVSII